MSEELKEEINEFLSSRRARLTPQLAGIPLDGTARRVPGLRRGEVADLAGISVDYYVLIERGNLSGASADILAALARALQLDEAERIHLANLARASRRDHGVAKRKPLRITPMMQGILDAITETPAWIRNEQFDILGTNVLGRALYDPIYRELPDRPNTARHCYLGESAESFWVDRDQFSEDFAARLRMEAAVTHVDPALKELLDELLRKSETFRRRWDTADVALLRSGLKRFHHPAVGQLDLNYETMNLNSVPGLVLSVYLPRPGSDAAAKLVALGEWARTQSFAPESRALE
ncbi:MmyB family transcriptional regulator [Corynebacterium sp. A21]|uniref:MmyB family transcriptional regulator n=1 Tax=Corynebacterium sp. A21 TaxID=3457318 RepID=UPI003FD2A543